MTGPEMNAPSMKKMIGLTGLVGGAVLSGCVGSFDPATDPTSPAAARVDALVAEHRQYPRWEDFPKAPAGLPTPFEVATQVNTLEATGGALTGEVSRIDWQSQDPTEFEREVAARVAATPVSPATEKTAEEVEAFAQSLRDRAAAPPAIPR